jgi:HEPN domain-containing protein
MPDRHADWLRQARRDLAHARRAAEHEVYEWSCFAAQQGAEKAVKAVYQRLGAVAWGHSVTMLLSSLPEDVAPPEALIERAKALDKHYIATRYPNGFERGAPMDYYTQAEAERSVEDGQAIIQFCADTLARLAERGGGTGSVRTPDEGPASRD